MSFSSSPCHRYAGEARFGRVVLSQTGHHGSLDPIEESWDPRRPPTRPQRSSEKPAGCAGGGRRGRRLIVTLAQGLGLRLRRQCEQGPEIESPPTHTCTYPSLSQSESHVAMHAFGACGIQTTRAAACVQDPRSAPLPKPTPHAPGPTPQAGLPLCSQGVCRPAPLGTLMM